MVWVYWSWQHTSMQTSHISSAQQWFSMVCQTLWLTIQQRKWGFPSGSVVKNLPASAGYAGSNPGNPRRKWQPAPVFLPGKSHGQRSLVGYSPWGRKESARLNTHAQEVGTPNWVTTSQVACLHFYQQIRNGPDPPHHLLSLTHVSNFFLMGAKWYLLVLIFLWLLVILAILISTFLNCLFLIFVSLWFPE